MKKLSEQIDESAMCSYALWEGVSNLENQVEMLTKQNDDLLAYNQTRTDELAASVEQAANLKKQRDELLSERDKYMRSMQIEIVAKLGVQKQCDELLAAIKRFHKDMENIAAGSVRTPVREYALHSLADFELIIANVKGGA